MTKRIVIYLLCVVAAPMQDRKRDWEASSEQIGGVVFAALPVSHIRLRPKGAGTRDVLSAASGISDVMSSDTLGANQIQFSRPRGLTLLNVDLIGQLQLTTRPRGLALSNVDPVEGLQTSASLSRALSNVAQPHTQSMPTTQPYHSPITTAHKRFLDSKALYASKSLFTLKNQVKAQLSSESKIKENLLRPWYNWIPECYERYLSDSYMPNEPLNIKQMRANIVRKFLMQAIYLDSLVEHTYREKIIDMREECSEDLKQLFNSLEYSRFSSYLGTLDYDLTQEERNFLAGRKLRLSTEEHNTSLDSDYIFIAFISDKGYEYLWGKIRDIYIYLTSGLDSGYMYYIKDIIEAIYANFDIVEVTTELILKLKASITRQIVENDRIITCDYFVPQFILGHLFALLTYHLPPEEALAAWKDYIFYSLLLTTYNCTLWEEDYEVAADCSNHFKVTVTNTGESWKPITMQIFDRIYSDYFHKPEPIGDRNSVISRDELFMVFKETQDLIEKQKLSQAMQQ